MHVSHLISICVVCLQGDCPELSVSCLQRLSFWWMNRWEYKPNTNVFIFTELFVLLFIHIQM